MLLRLTISELITLLHNQETAKINSTNNNRTILATSTESTITYLKKTIGFFLLCQSISLPATTFLYSLLQLYNSLIKNLVAIYKNRKNNPENARAKSREKRKKALLSYIIDQQNSSKKLVLLDQSGILLCHKQL